MTAGEYFSAVRSPKAKDMPFDATYDVSNVEGFDVYTKFRTGIPDIGDFCILQDPRDMAFYVLRISPDRTINVSKPALKLLDGGAA